MGWGSSSWGSSSWGGLGPSAFTQNMVAQAMMFFSSIKGTGANDILDEPLRRFLFTRAGAYVVLNSEQDGYAELVAAIKAEFPAIKVLRYTNAQRVPEGTRIAATMFNHFLANAATEALIKNNGQPKILGTTPARTIWTDITVQATRDFIAAHIAEQVAAHDTDGIAIDSFRTELDPFTLYVDGEAKNDAWPDAAMELLQAIRAALPAGKEVWINGLWSFTQDQIDRQAAGVLGRHRRPCPTIPAEEAKRRPWWFRCSDISDISAWKRDTEACSLPT
jgi:hypothetical protein